MRKLLLAAALAALAATPAAQAADAPILLPDRTHAPDGAARESGEHMRRRLFVSPSGEPFREGRGLAAWFAAADADHDGALTPAEFQADALRAFRLYDANGDGVIDGFEIQAYERDRVPEIAELPFAGDEGGGGRRLFGGRSGGHGRGHRGGGMSGGMGGDGQEGDGQPAPSGKAARMVGAGREGAARFSLLNEPEPILAADEDVDGKVTLAEWIHATARRFAKLDRAHAGRLTLAALQAPPPR